jgi:glycosyltransferase involved in cell wall biosynthesis
MDVVVCGAHKPFARGGAEQHQENLVRALRAAGHQADLVRVPVAWERDRVFDAALAWRLLAVDAEVVIATNFPSYYVRHPRKVVWLFHQHRAAYDMAGAEWSDFRLDDASLEAQRMLTEWDTVALREAARLFTTSRTVADRLARYNGLAGEALYHPPPLYEDLRPGPFGNYVLSVGRFAANKRPGLLVEAMAQVRNDIRATLVGEGELFEPVRSRARQLRLGKRVELTGFVDDARLVELFAGSLAVVYAPLDEDYGYVTLQAFLAGKPVVTATDSGGVLEWVEDGVTGLVTDGTPEQLAAAVDRLADDPELARKLGEAGRHRVQSLDWSQVVHRLLAR